MDMPTAAQIGKLERVKLLVEQGVDKDKVDSNGNAPLFLDLVTAT